MVRAFCGSRIGRTGGCLARLALCVFLLLTSCTVGPDYRRPELRTPPAWNAAADGSDGDPSAELASWWARFGDPLLSDLIERAVRANLDLRIAEARVREARALRGVAGAALWPQLDALGEATTAAGNTESLFFGALEAFWELDVFGGVRRSVEAANADLDVAIEARRAVLLAMLGEVARSYVDHRGVQHRIGTVRRNLAAQQETRELTEAQLRVGLASDLVVDRARAQVAVTASTIPPLETELAASAHRLAVLIGAEPAALTSELAGDTAIPSAPSVLLLGVPADLLRRRPDLARAERELAAATARIGEATADLLPRFTLTGAIGLRSDDVKDLAKGNGSFAAIGPNVVWPIFAAGRIRANIAVQDARQQQALANYERTLLLALEEVENALVRHAREQVRRRDLQSGVESNRSATELARRLYANGLIEFLDVLDAERSLLVSESLLVDSETAVSTSLVDLYVALGGGWEGAEELTLR